MAAAQEPPRPSIEFASGYAGFVDESPVNHFTLGGGWRWHATRRLSLGPEIVYMQGPHADRDLFLTARLVLDSMPAARASLYFVADGGIMLHRDGFLQGTGWYKEGAGSFGGGVRIDVTDRVYVAPEVRIGWEPHVRATVVVGWRLR
jgi:hypothetical protein